MNIIITNIGRRGYLVTYFKALKNVKVFVSDCDKTASGLYGSNDGHFILPKPVNDEKLYVDTLINVCHDHNITVVLPVIDPEIFILAKYKNIFKQQKITVIVSDEKVLNICFDKLKMNDFLDDIFLQHPKTYSNFNDFTIALTKNEINFPVVIKPILGSGSVDTFFVDNVDKAKILFKPGMIIQEKLNGIEYGTDTFNSFEGKPLRCVIKQKLAMRSGETDKSVSVYNDELREVLLKLAIKLGHIGNLDCDVIAVKDKFFIIDMNPRFGGGYPATHAVGVNLVEVLYHLLNGENVVPEFNNYRSNILVMKEIAIKTTMMPKLAQ